MSPSALLHRSLLRVDPLYRCVALLLPEDSISMLPFPQTQAGLDVMEIQKEVETDPKKEDNVG